MKLKHVALLFMMSGISFSAAAQDTLKLKSDSTKSVAVKHSPWADHSPLLAGLSSAVLPGAGQVYNKKYWKVPIVYAGLATAGYFIYYNGTVYTNVRKSYLDRIDNNETTNLDSFKVSTIFSSFTVNLTTYDDDQLLTIQDQFRNYLDLTVIVGVAVYALNIIDAIVDAHLYHFDVSDDLSLHWQPALQRNLLGTFSPSISLSLNF